MKLVQALLGLILVAWMVSESQQLYGMSKLGPYIGKVEQVLLCEDQGTGKGNFNVSLYLGPPDASRKRTRKRLHRGSFSWPFTRDQENIVIDIDVYLRKSNNYLLMNTFDAKFCVTVTRYVVKIYKSLRKAMGLNPEGCVIPYGNHTLNDWEVPFELPAPMLEYGFYKAKIRVVYKKEVYGCFEVLIDVKPK